MSEKKLVYRVYFSLEIGNDKAKNEEEAVEQAKKILSIPELQKFNIEADGAMLDVQELPNVYDVIDFGNEKEDRTLGYPFRGTDKECSEWIEKNLKETDRPNRYAVQFCPPDEE